MPLSEHVYCVSVTVKMTEWVEQQICIKFCIKLEHSSTETIWMIQRAAAIGNWWLTASSQQSLSYYALSLMQNFSVKHQITQMTQSPNSPDLKPCNFWLSPKLKSPFKGKRFQIISEIQENMTGQLMAIGRTVWGPKMPTLKGTEVSLSYVQCFLYIVSSSVNVSIFHITWLNIFCTDLMYFLFHMYIHISRIMDYMVGILLRKYDIKLFSKWLYSFMLPSAMYVGSSCSSSIF